MNLNEMYQVYTKNSAAKKFLLGFNLNGKIYVTSYDEKNAVEMFSQSVASRNAGNTIRFRPTNKIKAEMLKNATEINLEMFNKNLEKFKNKGVAFEATIHEMNGINYKKESIPFYQEPDITINKIGYEIKFEGATITNEKIIKNLLARA